MRDAELIQGAVQLSSVEEKKKRLGVPGA